MWVIIILVILAIIIAVVIKKANEKAEAKRKEQEAIARREKAAAEAKAKKAKYGTVTEAEKQAMKQIGNNHLNSFLNAYQLAVKGDIKAMLFMGTAYDLEIKNAYKAAYWIEKAANAGSKEAKYILGTYYMDGYGVKENRVKGTSLIIEAAKMGDKDAINCLYNKFNMTKEEMRSRGIPV